MAHERGFTLLEMLLSLTLMGILTGLSMPLYLSFQNRNDLSLTTELVAQTMRRAEVYARGVNADSQWGVSIQPTSAVLFKGSSYASRDTAYDEPISLPASITPTGLNEVLFSKVSALPSTTGNITFTSNTNDVRTISINAQGMVSY